MVPPGSSFSFATASATSPSSSAEFCQSGSFSVREATYFRVPFRWPANGSSAGAFGQWAAMIS